MVRGHLYRDLGLEPERLQSLATRTIHFTLQSRNVLCTSANLRNRDASAGENHERIVHIGTQSRDRREHLAAAFDGCGEREPPLRFALKDISHVLHSKGDVSCLIAMREACQSGCNSIRSVVTKKFKQSQERSFSHHARNCTRGIEASDAPPVCSYVLAPTRATIV